MKLHASWSKQACMEHTSEQVLNRHVCKSHLTISCMQHACLHVWQLRVSRSRLEFFFRSLLAGVEVATKR